MLGGVGSGVGGVGAGVPVGSGVGGVGSGVGGVGSGVTFQMGKSPDKFSLFRIVITKSLEVDL